MITSERIVGTHTIGGRRIDVQVSTWRGQDGLSYDLLDADSGETLTVEESFAAYPTEEQMRSVLSDLGAGPGAVHCRFCLKQVPRDARRVGAAEPGTNPYCCDGCWDERLA